MRIIVGGHWTYSGDPAASSKDAVRHLIGDTNEDDQLLSDEEIEWEIGQASSVRAAAANSCRSLAMRYSLQPSSKKVGDFSITYGERSALLTALADKIDTDAALVAVPYAGGISVSDKDIDNRDHDLVRPSFYRGQDDYRRYLPRHVDSTNAGLLMGWDVPLEGMMADTVTVYAGSTPAADGSDSFSTSGTTYPARVTFDPATIVRVAGPTDDVSAVAWVASTSIIERDSSIALPDGSRPPIKQVVRVDDEDGLYAVKVLFGG